MSKRDDSRAARNARPGPDAGVTPIDASADDLLRVVGRAPGDDCADRPLDAADERYLRWRAHELRASLDDAERAELSTRASAWAGRAMARRLAAELRVRLAGAPPGECPLDEPRPVRRVMEEGRRGGRIAAGDWRVAAGSGRELWDEPCVATIERPDGLPRGDYLALRVAGESMTPLLHDGDLVLVKVGERIATNTLVVARRPDDGWVIKRVGSVTPTEIELESLNPDFPPADIPNDGRLVLGTVVMRWCAHEAA